MKPERIKPFPWRCPACAKKTVRAAEVPYKAKIKHDGRLHEIEVAALHCGRCVACGELVFSAETDEQIMRALRKKLRLLQPDEIRTAREALSLTQAQLADRIGTAQETISRWESGLHIQTRAMDNLLRVFFEVGEVRQVLASDPIYVREPSRITSLAGIPELTWMLASEAFGWMEGEVEWPEIEPEFPTPNVAPGRLAA